MSFRIAADGGGTKLIVILYDENYQILRVARSGATNDCFKAKETIAAEIGAMVDELFAGDVGKSITRIDSFASSIVGDHRLLVDSIERYCPVTNVKTYGEGDVALGASGAAYGVVAQAGTGSDAFLIQPDSHFVVGGWGALLGDEGSGYDIGLHAIKAALWASDGRGPETKLLPMILEKLGLSGPWDIVYFLSGNPDYRAVIASLTRVAGEAAAMGDPVAVSLFEDAGREMGLQVRTALRRYGKTIEGPVVASGGAWKGSPRMFEAFRNDVLNDYPDLTVTYPIFEPVVGSVILNALEGRATFSQIEPILRSGFSDFLYGGR